MRTGDSYRDEAAGLFGAHNLRKSFDWLLQNPLRESDSLISKRKPYESSKQNFLKGQHLLALFSIIKKIGKLFSKKETIGK